MASAAWAWVSSIRRNIWRPVAETFRRKFAAARSLILLSLTLLQICSKVHLGPGVASVTREEEARKLMRHTNGCPRLSPLYWTAGRVCDFNGDSSRYAADRGALCPWRSARSHRRRRPVGRGAPGGHVLGAA